MGIGQEAAVLNQLKKGQGEMNERLDRLIALMEELLAKAGSLSPRP
jgi:hypothetical protein